LLHFIVKTVREKFPDVAGFDAEEKYIEKASAGNAGFLPQWGKVCISLSSAISSGDKYIKAF